MLVCNQRWLEGKHQSLGVGLWVGIGSQGYNAVQMEVVVRMGR